jgi:hypothetical protein
MHCALANLKVRHLVVIFRKNYLWVSLLSVGKFLHTFFLDWDETESLNTLAVNRPLYLLRNEDKKNGALVGIINGRKKRNARKEPR